MRITMARRYDRGKSSHVGLPSICVVFITMVTFASSFHDRHTGRQAAPLQAMTPPPVVGPTARTSYSVQTTATTTATQTSAGVSGGPSTKRLPSSVESPVASATDAPEFSTTSPSAAAGGARGRAVVPGPRRRRAGKARSARSSGDAPAVGQGDTTPRTLAAAHPSNSDVYPSNSDVYPSNSDYPRSTSQRQPSASPMSAASSSPTQSSSSQHPTSQLHSVVPTPTTPAVSLFSTSHDASPWTDMSASDRPAGSSWNGCPPDHEDTIFDKDVRLLWVRPRYWRRKCVPSFTWHIIAPQGHGMVVIFHNIHLVRGSKLKFVKAGNPDMSDDATSSSQYRVFSDRRYYDFSPLVIYQNELDITANDLHLKINILNITFLAYPVDSLPSLKIRRYRDNLLTLYSCDRPGVIIPQPFMCDGVQQCVGREDEVNCSYRNEGCRDWVPFRDKCIDVLFLNPQSGFGRLMPHWYLPAKAEEMCKSKKDTYLAVLPDEEAVRFVGNLIRQSGYVAVVVGLKKFQPQMVKLAHLYKYTWQWGGRGSPVAHDLQDIQRQGVMMDCAVLSLVPKLHLKAVSCVKKKRYVSGFACMRDNPLISAESTPVTAARFSTSNAMTVDLGTKQCPDGSLVQRFHPCLWGDAHSQVPLSESNLPLFPCRLGTTVHYAVVCDGVEDCADGSDERACAGPRFSPLKSTSFVCQDSQLISLSRRCDGLKDCLDESDEQFCSSCSFGEYCPGVGCVGQCYVEFFSNCPLSRVGKCYSYELMEPPVPAVHLDGLGWSYLTPAPNISDKVFTCFSGMRVPSYMVNNGEKDCSHGDDEDIPWENVTCPGYYRCHQFGQCLHPDFVCDGLYHCPNKDDERFCRLPCPHNCTCEGFAYTCNAAFSPAPHHLQVRYLDLSGVTRGLAGFLQEVHFMELLHFLNLSRCGLSNVTLRNTSQLRVLDLSHNHLADLSTLHLKGLTGVSCLNLSHNPLGPHLDLTFAAALTQAGLTQVKTLILTNTEVTSITDRALSPLSELTTLDLRGNSLERYDSGIFYGVNKLQVLHTKDGKLCCQYFHRTPLDECHSPVPELSSCGDLLHSDYFRVFLWLMAVLSVTGNAGVLLYRLVTEERATPPAFRMLVKNLCASDLLMGVYMLMIGVADAQFRGRYVEKEAEWRRSAVCTVAGFLAFVSSEMSALVICFITLDRLLVICFPFQKSFHLKAKSTAAVCCCLWCMCLILGAVPLFAGLEFYGQTGICLPLPITRQRYSGHHFAFAVFIVLNFVLFLLIGAGQVCIYRAVRLVSSKAGAKRPTQEMTIARRLFLVVLTDFCCWFPIGLMGLLAASGVPVPGVVNVWSAIFVLPLNSALNPFLYTLNTVLDKREKTRLEAQTRRMVGKLHAEIPKWSPNMVEETMHICLQSNLVKTEQIHRMLGKLLAEIPKWSTDMVEETIHICLQSNLVKTEQIHRMLGKLLAEIPKWSPDMVEETMRICLQSNLVKTEQIHRMLGLGGERETLPSSIKEPMTRDDDVK